MIRPPKKPPYDTAYANKMSRSFRTWRRGDRLSATGPSMGTLQDPAKEQDDICVRWKVAI